MSPIIQQKMYDEVKKVTQGDDNCNINYDHFKELHYCKDVFKETLRLHPTISFIQRKFTENTEICGYPIKKGVFCVLFFSLFFKLLCLDLFQTFYIRSSFKSKVLG